MNAVYFHLYFHPVIMDMIQKDYQKIDERLGTNEDFKRCVMPCMKKESKVILDGVFNHVGREFFAFEDVREKEMGFSI